MIEGPEQQIDAGHGMQHVRCCEGFRMPAHDDGATHSGAGVRKPPKEETAGERAPIVRRDLSAARNVRP
jgi:hypothetical protein